MGTFSPIHWIIAIGALAALGVFVYFVGSLLWAGAKVKGKGRLIAAVVLLPVAVLAVIGLLGLNDGPKEQSPEQGPWLEYQKGR